MEASRRSPRGLSGWRHAAIGLAFAAGLLLRLVVLGHTTELGPKIVDEQQYLELATSLAEGHGFAWKSGELTSLRPPLYPAIVAAVWTVTDSRSLQTIRLLQIVMELITAWLVYDIGRRVFSRGAGRAAALLTWLYPSFIYYAFTALTEVLFTFLLVVFVWLTIRLAAERRWSLAVMTGIALGLSALTRSVLWPLPLLLCPLLAGILWADPRAPSPRHSTITVVAGLPFLLLVGYVAVIGPWAVRNTKLQRVPTIIDTMGGLNLRMGNYEYTPEDRMWDAVSVAGERSWVHQLTLDQAAGLAPMNITEGMKDKWAQRKAIEYITVHPGITLRRDAIKFGDFWGIERTFAAGWQQGLYAPPTWFGMLGALSMAAALPLLIVPAVVGMWTARPAWPNHLLLLLPIAALTGAHTIVFGHERYHLPLIPLLALYAASFGVRRSSTRDRRLLAGAIGLLTVLAVFWIRQVAFIDTAHVRSLLHRFW
jgi:4-amino-4-deoxy-L-arabinose transferase-like glycosyltransferase